MANHVTTLLPSRHPQPVHLVRLLLCLYFLNFYSYLFKQVKNNIYCDEEESDDYKKRGEK